MPRSSLQTAFTLDHAPLVEVVAEESVGEVLVLPLVKVKATGVRVPYWTFRVNGLVVDVQVQFLNLG